MIQFPKLKLLKGIFMKLNEMSTIDFFEFIKNNPEKLFLGKNICYLQQFLTFFPKKCEENDLWNYFIMHNNFLYYERAFLLEKGMSNKIKSSLFWSKEIRSVCNTDEEGFYMFFLILEQFVVDYNEGLFSEETLKYPMCERSNKNIGRYSFERK